MLAVAARTKDDQVRQAIIESKVAFALIAASLPQPPSVVFLNYTFIVLFNTTEKWEWTSQLIQANLVNLLVSDWYKNHALDDTTVQNGIASLINVLKMTPVRLPVVQEQEVAQMYEYLKENRKTLANAVQFLGKALARAKGLPSGDGKGGGYDGGGGAAKSKKNKQAQQQGQGQQQAKQQKQAKPKKLSPEEQQAQQEQKEAQDRQERRAMAEAAAETQATEKDKKDCIVM
jgi:hypothetical protein